jgi:small subunit ribosomal protein S8
MYVNLLTHIQNAQKVKKEKVKTPYSAMDEQVLEILAKKHFIAGYEKKGRNPKKYLEIDLLYKNGAGAIQGVKFISVPSRHIYKKYSQLKPVKQGYGVAVLSTSKGIMTDADAKKEKTGGEILFNIW